MVYTKAYSAKAPTTAIEIHRVEKTNQITAAIEEEKKIAAMNLTQLRSYACPKALQSKDDWYMTCVSCSGNKNCKPGRRVLEILETETQPTKAIPSAKNVGRKNGNCVNYALVGKEAFIEVLKQPDPVAYIMEKNHTTMESARGRFYKWKKKYPELVPDSMKPDPQNCGRNIHNVKTESYARKTVAEAFTYPKGVIAYFTEVLHVTNRSTMRNRISHWIAVYKDLDEKYHMSEWMFKTRKKPYAIKQNPDSVLEEPIIEIPTENIASKDISDADDEISITDFLDKITDDTEDISEEKPIATHEEKVDRAVRDANLYKEIEKKQNQVAACVAFSDKRKDILKRIDTIEAGIMQYQKELTELRGQLTTLDSAAKIMGFVVDTSQSAQCL